MGTLRIVIGDGAIWVRGRAVIHFPTQVSGTIAPGPYTGSIVVTGFVSRKFLCWAGKAPSARLGRSRGQMFSRAMHIRPHCGMGRWRGGRYREGWIDVSG